METGALGVLKEGLIGEENVLDPMATCAQEWFTDGNRVRVPRSGQQVKSQSGLGGKGP